MNDSNDDGLDGLILGCGFALAALVLFPVAVAVLVFLLKVGFVMGIATIAHWSVVLAIVGSIGGYWLLNRVGETNNERVLQRGRWVAIAAIVAAITALWWWSGG
jgi:hypothetical protein